MKLHLTVGGTPSTYVCGSFYLSLSSCNHQIIAKKSAISSSYSINISFFTIEFHKNASFESKMCVKEPFFTAIALYHERETIVLVVFFSRRIGSV